MNRIEKLTSHLKNNKNGKKQKQEKHLTEEECISLLETNLVNGERVPLSIMTKVTLALVTLSGAWRLNKFLYVFPRFSSLLEKAYLSNKISANNYHTDTTVGLSASRNVEVIERSLNSVEPIKGRRINMGTQERSYIYYAWQTWNKSQEQKLFFSVQLSKMFSLQEMRVALRKCQRKHPLLRCTVVFDFELDDFFFREEPDMEIQIQTCEDCKNFDEVFKKYAEYRPLLLEEELPIKLFICGDVISFDMPHFMLDACGLVIFIDSFLKFLTSHTDSIESVPYGAWPSTLETQCVTTFEKKNFGSPTWAVIKYIVSIIPQSIRGGVQFPIRQDNPDSVRNRTYCKFGVLDVNSLLERCRKNGITITAALGAAFSLPIVMRASNGGKHGRRKSLFVCFNFVLGSVEMNLTVDTRGATDSNHDAVLTMSCALQLLTKV